MTSDPNQWRESKLRDFVDWANTHIKGDEKGEAQTFIDHLFQAFGQKGAHEVGGTFEERIKQLFDDTKKTSFADYVWKPVVLIEMKKRGADLAKHRQQAFDYWTHIAPGRPKYVVLCNFDEFWVYDFNNQLYSPKGKVTLADLPTQWGPLAFLFPTKEEPTFGNDREKVTREAADKLAVCFTKMVARGVDRDLAQRFVLQSMVAMFAEDIGLLPRYLFTNLVKECEKPEDSYDKLGGLFEAMNTNPPVTGGRYKGVRYFNGGVFAHPARVELYPDELLQLRGNDGKLFGATDSDWSKVEPEIFGAIFQDSMDAEERHAFGAHFTSAEDIMKIVKPTISDPWAEAIAKAKTAAELNDLLERLSRLRVLDPACGSGNFLYLAYREMKRLEMKIRERIDADFPKSHVSFASVSPRQFFGIDVNPFAVELAKITLMLGRKLAIDELHINNEPDLPLYNLDDNFHIGDALVCVTDTNRSGKCLLHPTSYEGALPTPWPEADVIIGNPPYLDARKMTKKFGHAYVKTLERLYPDVPRRADHCTYWIRRTADHLPVCLPSDRLRGRAGLVGTQNIRNNESRVGGLDHVVKASTIVEAVENQPWSGDAVVNVSIVNWIHSRNTTIVPERKKLWRAVTPAAGTKRPRKKGIKTSKIYDLESRTCDLINSALSDETDVSSAVRLKANYCPKRCFEGQQPGHLGFKIDRTMQQSLVRQEQADAVIFLYMGGDDLLKEKYRTSPDYIIDFGERDLLQASAFPRTLETVRSRVLADWTKNAADEKGDDDNESSEHANRLETWWRLKRRRGELLKSIEHFERYIVCVRHTKRPIFGFISSDIRPDSALTCFALQDDYSFGVLQSATHWKWFITKCSKIKSEFRYTPDSVFDTFPWPQSPTKKQIDAVAAAAVEVRRVRGDALKVATGGLRAVYKLLELPGKHPLKDAHAALDAAVLAAYGFSAKKDLLAQLLELNLAVATKEKAGEPVTAPGVPPSYGDPTKLITDDCIRP